MNDIAICGKDTRFCRMLELELRAQGYTVARSPHSGHFRLWIIDSDTVTLTDHDRLYLGFTRDEAALAEDQRAMLHAVLHRPFTMEELRHAVMRLLSPEHTLSVRPHLPLIHTAHGFELDGEPMKLTDAEMQVLQYLYEHRGETVTREELCEILKSESNPKLADVYVCLLRKKLESTGLPRLLFTVRGVGYRLEAEIKSSNAQ